MTPNEAILAISKRLGVKTEGYVLTPENVTLILNAVEILADDHANLKARHAAVIRKVTGQHPNTLAAVAASFNRRGL
ncbi:hypothetical protein [Streptomyces phage phiScoe10]|nr:hypothetical protein [Streptomyces phage phiScoe10]